MATVKRIKLEGITRDARLQPRETIPSDSVASYEDAMREGAAFPPIIIFDDGQRMWLADGFTRVLAAMKLGRVEIDAEIHAGSFRDAWIYSRGANATHGVPRTRADLARVIRSVLLDDDLVHWTNARLAALVQASRSTVERHRATMETSGEIPTLDVLQGSDGKCYPRRASEPVADPMATAVDDAHGNTPTVRQRVSMSTTVDYDDAPPPDDGPVYYADADEDDEDLDDEDLDDEDDDEDLDDEDEDEDGPAPAAPPPPSFTAAVIRDVDDRTVPDGLRPVFEAFAAHMNGIDRAFDVLVSLSTRFMATVRDYPDLLGADHMRALEGVVPALQGARLAMHRARPARVCQGHTGAKCKTCRGLGWTPEVGFES